ncbi:RCC1/BLIP-II protein [Sistotremastrum suecicum HHB10207 ss-3]|uniref:RCC1/BLIP-II protein n=1 Tax=Sistotremastrum suecicum HHB10207 ss-3 TaxID=1314776 RepID=A0A166IWE7_9AGAM|nr:RCC1/BLIP-II protein [Sistotremastrum suecicum HHB10207 ss-3]
MLRSTRHSTALARCGLRRNVYSGSVNTKGSTLRSKALVATSCVAVVVALGLSRDTIQNDAPAIKPKKSVPTPSGSSLVSGKDSLEAIVWGSNKNHVLSSSSDEAAPIKRPELSPIISNTALRDLAVTEEYGVCVDARGDIYQWGDGFSGPLSPSDRPPRPQKTLSGKDISSIALTPNKVVALSKKSGKIYILSSKQNQQDTGKPSGSWSLSKLWTSSNPQVDYIELETNVKLHRSEKFTSISAGKDHLVALTSSGRTFSLPLSLSGNSSGQLGLRKVSVRSDSSSPSLADIELTPKAARDPYATATPYIRASQTSQEETVPQPAVASSVEQSKLPKDDDIRFCTTLYEIPTLQGINVAQIVAGARTTYARTEMGGRVLAWGANEYGQLGLGPTVTLPHVSVPTEVVFSKTAPSGTASTCTNIAAGPGDIVYFLVQRKTLGTSNRTFDVLACGMGQWGAIGNGLFTNAQGTPSKVKLVSGVQEFHEQDQTLRPLEIYNISTSDTGHTLLTLDTAARTGPGANAGRDLVAWGLNQDYQLGNGKRSSLPTPIYLTNDEGNRVALQVKEAPVSDMSGKPWSRKAWVEQTAVAGPGCSIVYWKLRT